MDARPHYDIFVSYAEADGAWVEGYLLDALAAAGVHVHSKAAFALGAPLLGEFEHAVRNSERTLLVLSPAYLADSFSQFGDLLAQAYGLESATWPVIPLILHPVDLPPRLAILTPLDMTARDRWPDAIERLGQALQHPVPRHASVSRPPCPYPGMVPFGEDDEARFFGRDADVDALVHALHISPFVTVIGPSGSGKSSLIFAGLIPALRESTLFGPESWQVFRVRPGPHPLNALQTALGRRGAARKGSLEAFFRRRASATRCLLIVDQFEELFTIADLAEADTFQSTLHDLVGIPNLSIVLTVRADFYAELMTSPLWPEIHGHRVEILPLHEVGLREAILRPAEATGVYVEAALVERLAADASGEPGMLPLLQETLVLLWEHLERRYLPLRAYETLVLPRRSYRGRGHELSGLQVAIARRADMAYAAQPAEQQSITRRVFVRLVHFGEGRADTRRQQQIDALRDPADDPQAFEDTMRALTQNRLLTLTGDEQGERLADLAHEALITGWPTLQEWLARRRDAEVVRRRLDAKAAEWTRLGRGTGGLLDEAELAEADRWFEDPMIAEVGAGDDVLELIRASHNSIEANRLEMEASRQRELELARDLAETQRRRAEDQTRVAGRLRRRLVVAALAAVVAVITASIALYAFRQANVESTRAEHQADLAHVRALAGQTPAQLQLHNDEIASLLAMQAWHFNSDTNGEAWHQVDMALRQIMSAPFFSHVLAPGTAVETLAFHPNETLLVTGDRLGAVKLWDVSEPGTPPELIQDSGTWIDAVAFSGDGDLLAVGAWDGSISLYRTGSAGAALWSLQAPATPISSLVVTGDTLTALVERDPRLYRWTVSSGEPAETLTPPGMTSAEAIMVGPDGQQLVVGIDGDAGLRVWNPDESMQESITLPGQDDWIPSGAIGITGQWLVAAGTDGSARVWDLENLASSPRPTQPAPTTLTLSAVAVDPDGQRVAAIASEGSVVVWGRDDSRMPDVLRGHESIGLAIAFRPDGASLATGGGDSARLWSLESPPEPRALLQVESGIIYDIAFSPDGQMLASGARDGSIRIWSPEETERAPTTLISDASQVTSLAFSPNGQGLAGGYNDGTVRLWNLDRPRMEPTVLPGEYWVVSIAFSPDGQLLVVAREREVELWDVVAGAPVHTLSFPGHNVQSVAIDPAGEWIAAGGCLEAGRQEGVCGRGGVAIWPLAGNTDAPQVHDVTSNTVMAVAFDHDGRRLAAAGRDGTVEVWHVDDPSANRVRLHGTGAASLAFSPTSEELAIGHWNGTISIWRLNQPGSPSLIPAQHTYVYAVAYAPDGQTIATAGADGTVQLWSSTEALAANACSRIGRNMSQQEWERLVGDIPYQATCPDLPPGGGNPP